MEWFATATMVEVLRITGSNLSSRPIGDLAQGLNGSGWRGSRLGPPRQSFRELAREGRGTSSRLTAAGKLGTVPKTLVAIASGPLPKQGFILLAAWARASPIFTSWCGLSWIKALTPHSSAPAGYPGAWKAGPVTPVRRRRHPQHIPAPRDSSAGSAEGGTARGDRRSRDRGLSSGLSH